MAAQIVDYWLFVEVYLNGAGPYTFIVDTGATNALVSPRIAALFPGSINGTTTVVADPSLGATQVPLFWVDQLTMGNVEFSGFQAVVLALDEPFKNLSFTVDGICRFTAVRGRCLDSRLPEQPDSYSNRCTARRG